MIHISLALHTLLKQPLRLVLRCSLVVLILIVLTSCAVAPSMGQVPTLASGTGLPAIAAPTKQPSSVTVASPSSVPQIPVGMATSPGAITSPPLPQPPTRTASPTTQPPVAKLPLDQPWVLVEGTRCSGSGGTLLAVAPDGTRATLATPVHMVLERAAQPPLVITCNAELQFAIVDTATWTSVQLQLPRDTAINSAVLAPDGRTLAISLYPLMATTSRLSLVALADVQTGTVHIMIDGAQVKANYPQFDYFGDNITPIAWDGTTLYTHVQSSATSYFWRLNVAVPDAPLEQVLIIGHTGAWSVAPTGRWLAYVTSVFQGALVLRDLRTGSEQPVEAPSPAIIPAGMAFTPTHLVYGRLMSNTLTVMRRSLTDGQTTSVATLTDLAAISGNDGLVYYGVDSPWSAKHQRLVVTTVQVDPTDPSIGQNMIVHELDTNGNELVSYVLPHTPHQVESLRLTPTQLLRITRQRADNVLQTWPVNMRGPTMPSETLLSTNTAGSARLVYSP